MKTTEVAQEVGYDGAKLVKGHKRPALVAGTEDPEVLAALAKGRMRTKQAKLAQALSGRVRDHHHFLIQTHLAHLEFLDAHLQPFAHWIEQLIEQHLPSVEVLAPSAPQPGCPKSVTLPLAWQQAMSLLNTIPGVARQRTELLLAEVGADMRRFLSAAHLCK